MNHEEILRQIRQQFGGQEQEYMDVPSEKLDEFINRCISELGYDEHSLYNQINWKLNGQPTNGGVVVCSLPELSILPLVLQRLEGKI